MRGAVAGEGGGPKDKKRHQYNAQPRCLLRLRGCSMLQGRFSKSCTTTKFLPLRVCGCNHLMDDVILGFGFPDQSH